VTCCRRYVAPVRLSALRPSCLLLVVICAMDPIILLSWNVRGLNTRARRDVVRVLMQDTRASIACLQETKLSVGPSQLHTWWEHLQRLQVREHRRGFDSLFMCITWAIWKERNNSLFEGTSCTAQELQDKIKLDIKLWIHAGARCLGCLKWE